MSNITLSILGMYNHDETLFDNMVVPTGVNKETLIDNILVECAELELLYPNLNFMKTYLGKWSLSRIDSWNKINNYYNVVINPINEFDYTKTRTANLTTAKTGTETDVKTGNKELTKTGSETDNLTKTGSETDILTKNGTESNNRTGSITDTGSNNRTANLTNTNQVSAYNSSDWENREKNTETGTDNHALSNTQTFNNLTDTVSFTNRSDNNTKTFTNRSDNSTKTFTNRKDTETYNDITDTTTHNTSVAETGTDTITETGHKTDPAKLIESALVLAVNNIYEFITNEFKEKFCLLIY